MIYVLRHRPGAQFDHIEPAGFRILSALDQATQVCQTDLMITSGTDSHAGGAHPVGDAYDVSVIGLSADQIEAVYTFLTVTLGTLFTVLYEVPKVPSDPTLHHIAYVNAHATGPHLHIQRNKGTVYPPQAPMVA